MVSKAEPVRKLVSKAEPVRKLVSKAEPVRKPVSIAEPAQKLVNSSSGNNCSRCGKARIAVSTYDETIGNSTITYTVTACSDPECQKMVDQNLLKEEKKREVFKDEQEKRAALKKQEFENSKKNV